MKYIAYLGAAKRDDGKICMSQLFAPWSDLKNWFVCVSPVDVENVEEAYVLSAIKLLQMIKERGDCSLLNIYCDNTIVITTNNSVLDNEIHIAPFQMQWMSSRDDEPDNHGCEYADYLAAHTVEEYCDREKDVKG